MYNALKPLFFLCHIHITAPPFDRTAGPQQRIQRPAQTPVAIKANICIWLNILFDISPGRAYNEYRPATDGVTALYLFTSYGAQVRGFFHALATLKRADSLRAAESRIQLLVGLLESLGIKAAAYNGLSGLCMRLPALPRPRP